MKVHELIARLARADPEDHVVFDPTPECLRIFNTRLGLFQPLDELEVLWLTEGEPAKVHELIARLAEFDPEDNVVFDPDSECLRLFNTRLGMFQPLDEMEFLELTRPDKQFLRDMNIQS